MYQVGAGAAYSFNDMVSLSAGARYVIARKEIGMEGRYSFANGATLDLDYETELSAEGYCFIFGVDVKPISDLNIGVKYETETALRYNMTIRRLRQDISRCPGLSSKNTERPCRQKKDRCKLPCKIYRGR
jgi:hypothetical protein